MSETADWTVDCWSSRSLGIFERVCGSPAASPRAARVSWIAAQASFSCSMATFRVLFRWSSSSLLSPRSAQRSRPRLRLFRGELQARLAGS